MADDSIRQVTDARSEASFTLANRAVRALWGVTYMLLFRPSPRFLHGWRRLVLRLFGAKVGRGAHVYPRVRIWAPWHLDIGDEAGIADGAILYSQAPIRIGARAVVSQGAHLCTGTHDYQSRTFQLVAKPIVVGSGAWIAAEAFVHPGVTIGDEAVVGARSVVTRDLPPRTVCAGNPCRQVGIRERGAK